MTSYSQRPRDFAYMAWIKFQPCCVCEKLYMCPYIKRTYAHHAGAHGLSQKSPDRTCIPLCWRHHDRNSSQSIHTLGKRFWAVYGLDRAALIREYNERYELETGRIAA
jgi:hypothetical protein